MSVDIIAVLSPLHKFLGNYVVPIAAVIALVGAVAGYLGSLPPRMAARRAALPYVIALDLQFLLGIIVYFGMGGFGALGRPHRLEHPLIMLLAVVALHVGQVLAKRAKSDKGAARTVAIAVAISFVLVLLGIPGLVMR